MEILMVPVFALMAYMLGSVPTAVWIGKSFYNVDVRQHGSGNAGATNTFRVLGRKPGIVVFLIDVLKGWLAVQLSVFINSGGFTHNQYVNIQILLGLSALLGHIFPLWAQFKGGKGVATLFGLVIALHPASAFLAFAVFILLFVSTRYVSVGSIAAGISYPLLVLFAFRLPSVSMHIFSVSMTGLLIFTHRKNIRRLINREESRFSFVKKGD